jgi:RHS repeat-associated protein
LSIQRYGDDSIEHEVIYLDGLDLRIDWDGYQKWTYYPEDHVITKKNDSGPFSHYFTFTDQVGSILKAVDANGTVKFSASYDPWGQQTVTTNQIGLIRGYTGHEMLTEYGLINMNGRLYDPLLGRFLSTDNFVQEPGSTQSFNRYSYCLNNPLKYTDPSGDLWWMPVLANICFNVAESCGNHEGLWQGVLKGMATSAISMAASYATMGIGNLFGHSLGGAGTELLRAGTHGLLNGAVNAIEGKSFGVGFASGAMASLFASGAETLGAGYGGMLTSSVVGGAIGSGMMGGSWIDGAMTGLRIGSLNHGWRYLNGERVYELDGILVIGHGPNYMSSIHTALDAAGVFLDVADAANAILYGLEGDYLNAGLSAAAMVPFFGTIATSGKNAKKAFEIIKEFGPNYTKSSVKQGIEIHKSYRTNKLIKDVYEKEYRGISGIKPDYVDFKKHSIYELKPYNPHSIRKGIRQLEKYRRAFEAKDNMMWNTFLEFY